MGEGRYGSHVGRRWQVLIAVGLALSIADQWTKYLAVKHLTPGIAKARASHLRATSSEDAAQLPDPNALTTDEVDALNADVGLFEGLSYLYFDENLKNPCRPAGQHCPTYDWIPGFWSFKYRENPGAAWGLFSTTNKSFRVPFFLVVSLAAVVFIIVFFRKLTDDQHLMVWSLSLVFGGALGNLIDRLHLRYVIDFIDWYVGTAHWPTFNVADAGITTGVALLMLEWLTDAVRSSRAASEPQA